MSSQANDRHIIWGDISLNFEDWKDDLAEQYPELSEDELYQKMYELNAEYLGDERMNLDIRLSQPILVIADLGRWSGRFSGYKEIGSGKISDCLYADTDYCEWYVDKFGDLRADAVHHDGTNHYLYRVYAKYETRPFNQHMTPYTEEGRRIYVSHRTKHKPLPCDRPSINTPEDILLSAYARGKGWKANFEYFMNREYAYNRDKGKCKCCGRYFSDNLPKHCHHVNNKLPAEKINKVSNLAWLCVPCHRMVHNSPIYPGTDQKTIRKIEQYKQKLT